MSDNYQRNNLFLLLNEEINKINTDQKKSGWTIWALLAALATMIWVLINQYENSNFEWTNLQIILIDVTFVYFFLMNIKSFFSIKSSKTDNLRYQTHKEIFSSSKSSLFIRLLWHLIILSFIITNKYFISDISRNFSYIIIAFYIGGFIISIIIPKNELVFLPKNPITGDLGSSYIKWIVRTILFFLIGLTAYSGYEWISNTIEINLIQIEVIKIAFLIIGIVVVVYLIFSQSPKSTLLNNLLQIRRDLALSHISNEEIINQIDNAINGQKLDNYLSSDISELLHYNNLFEKEINLLTENLSSVRKENQFTEHLKDSIFKSLVYASKIEYDQIRKRIKTVLIKERLMKIFANNDNSRKLFFEEIVKTEQENVDNFNNVIKEYFSLIKNFHGDKAAKEMILDLKKYVPQLNYSKISGEIID